MDQPLAPNLGAWSVEKLVKTYFQVWYCRVWKNMKFSLDPVPHCPINIHGLMFVFNTVKVVLSAKPTPVKK